MATLNEEIRVLGLTRRQLILAGSALAGGSVVSADCGPGAGSDSQVRAVPSGRADGVPTGGARKIPIAGGHEVWVKQVGVGDLPLLTPHGGPGMPHFYIERFREEVELVRAPLPRRLPS